MHRIVCNSQVVWIGKIVTTIRVLFEPRVIAARNIHTNAMVCIENPTRTPEINRNFDNFLVGPGTVGFNDFTVPASKLEQMAKGAQMEPAEQMLAQIRQLSDAIETPDQAATIQ